LGVWLLGICVGVGIIGRLTEGFEYNHLMLEWLHLPYNELEAGRLGPITLDELSQTKFQTIGDELSKVCLSSSSFRDVACMRAGMAKLLFSNDMIDISMELQRFPNNSFEQVMLAAFIGDTHYRMGDTKTSLYLWQSYLPAGMKIQRAIVATNDRNYDLAATLVGRPGQASLPQSLGERLELVRPIEALAMNSMAIGDATEAESYWRWAIALFSDRAIYYNGLGSVLSEQGRFLEAVESFERAIQLDPDNALHYVGLAQVYLKHGDTALARKAAEQGLILDPADPAAQDLLQLLQK
jgi:tetratricopeptide (TPR) repeat protein